MHPKKKHFLTGKKRKKKPNTMAYLIREYINPVR